MTDLVARLRADAQERADYVGCDHEDYLQWKAADEIERLRAALDDERKSRDADAICYDSLWADNERLRAQVAELERDAGRYRTIRASKWLSYTTDYRDDKGMDPVDLIVVEIPLSKDEPDWTPDGHFDYAKELDDAVDAAIDKAREGAK